MTGIITKILSGCCLIVLLLSSNQASAFDHTALARMAYKNHLYPGYELLAKETSALHNSLTAFCRARDQAGYESVKKHFRSALVSWSRMEHIRFGPVVEEYRYERYSYWPDRKGRGLRQVRKVLAERDPSVLSREKLSQKSIALQGLTALEFLLYGTDHDVLLNKGENGGFRCAYARAIGHNLKVMSEKLVEAWGAKAEYTKAFLNPGDNGIFLKPSEVTLALFQAYVTGYAKARRFKILGPLGELKNKVPNAKRSSYWRSQLTIDVLVANLEGLSQMFLKGGFSKLTKSTDPTLERSVILVSNNGLRILKRIHSPIQDILSDEKRRAKFRFIATVFSVLRGQTGTVILKSSGLTIGFNAEDGD